MEKFEVTKKFISGTLNGIFIKERTSVPYVEGKVYKGVIGSSDYVIVRVEPCVERDDIQV